MINKIIFDLDDTLVNTGIIYERQIKEFIETLIQDLDFDKLSFDEISKIQEDIDIKQIDKYGFSTVRFPLSFSLTFKFICNNFGIKFDKVLNKKYMQIGEKVFQVIPELAEGVNEILEKFFNKYFLVIYTLGDKQIQKDKIIKNNLHKYFKEYFIVPEKNIDNLITTCKDTPFNECAIVGDSLKGEIEPGVKLGMQAFYLDRPKKWKYLNSPIGDGFIRIKNLLELTDYL